MSFSRIVTFFEFKNDFQSDERTVIPDEDDGPEGAVKAEAGVIPAEILFIAVSTKLALSDGGGSVPNAVNEAV